MSAGKREHVTYGESVPVSLHNLRALLFWATIGVTNSMSGSYPDASEQDGDEGIIRSYARYIKYHLPRAPKFREER